MPSVSKKRLAKGLNLSKVKNASQAIIENTIQEGISQISTTPVSKSKIEKENSSNDSSDDDMLILLYILAVLIPFVAVGIATDWDLKKVLINLLLSFLCYIPGVIHAFIVIRDYYR